MSILEQFGLNSGDFSVIADSPEMFESTSQTTTLRAGREVSFNATINGIKVPASATLHDARLTRLSQSEQVSPNTGKSYILVTGIMRPVKMDLFVTIDGNKMNIIDVLHNVVNSGSNQITRQQFIETTRKIGMDLENGMPFFFQQFGANIESFRNALELFKEAGAKDVISKMKNAGSIQTAYEHSTGVPITAFEVGTVNRSKSRTNQGFQNLVDSIVDNFQRVVRLRKESKLLEATILDSKNWSQEKTQAARDQSKLLMDMSRQWSSNWAGAQQRCVVSPNNKKEVQNIWDPVSAPCGRFTMVIDGKPVDVDLWSNSARANTSNASIESTTVSEDLPF